MGRKPNQLILEFFERGPKLEDASNRYQHTCKSCGEKFPKGRIDSLTNHLVKKCPALPLRDRQRAALQFHELPDLPDMSQLGPAPGSVQNGPTMNLPFAPSKQGMSALETLAEVSRQRLDLSVQGKPTAKTPPPLPNAPSSQGGLLDEFLIQDDRPDGDLGAVSQALDMSNAPALPSIYQFNGPLQHSPTGSPHMAHMPLSTSGSMAHMANNLVMTASAANELSNIMPLNNGLMEPELNLSNTGISDKFFHNQGRPQWPIMQQPSIDPLLQEHNRNNLSSKDDIDMNKSIPQPRPIAMNPNSGQAHFTTDFSMNQKPVKPKVRGRFSDTRRKEVQEVRKRGACIRCRMLKKPCSGDNPCSTCQNVESARLWKQPCIRTRIAEEFSLFSAGLHGFLAFQAVNQAKGQASNADYAQIVQSTGRIEATHFVETGIFATFTPLQSRPHAVPGSDIDPAILATLSSSNLTIVDGDDDIGGKLDLYVMKAANSFYESEDSTFMKTTIRIALGVTSSNQDGLLTKALELWNFTRVLTAQNMTWKLFSNPSLAPTMAPPTMSGADVTNSARTSISPGDESPSYELIRMQLQGAIEKRAASLARVVMNDLERRLLQRQQANPFETFLVAVVLLSCVERMCWLFRTWEDQIPAVDSVTGIANSTLDAFPNPRSQGTTTEDAVAAALRSQTEHPIPPSLSSQPHPPKWPFDKPPAFYSQQGERISDILNMLLKMRGVPPKPVPRSSDGVLVLFGDDADEKAREWYENITVTNEMLAERSNAQYTGQNSKEWELKFVGKIIGGM